MSKRQNIKPFLLWEDESNSETTGDTNKHRENVLKAKY